MQLSKRPNDATLVERVKRISLSRYGKEVVESNQTQAKGFKGGMAKHLRDYEEEFYAPLAACQLPVDYLPPRQSRIRSGHLTYVNI